MSNISQAPEEVQLAVDLIFLFESNKIDDEIILKALEIVKRDYLKKQSLKQDNKLT